MTAKYILVFLLTLVGQREFDGAWRFAQAIAAATADRELQAAAAVVAWRENWCHVTSYPPFGLTWYVAHTPSVCLHREGDRRGDRPGCEALTIEDGARRSVHLLRYIRDVQCSGHPWSHVFGRYFRAPCEPRPMATRQAEAMERALRAWSAE